MTAAPAATSRTRIHVGGLGQSVSSDDLRKIFSAVGTVEGVDIVRTKGRSFAYVDILPSSSNSISKLFSMYNGCAWKGGKLKLEKAKEHFLARLKREWEETQFEAEDEEGSLQAKQSSSNSSNGKNKVHGSQINQLQIFFPRLSKVKSLPFSGTGKHRYSFQRVQTPTLPIHFCDCEEHSGRFDATKPKDVQHHEEISGAMNEEELSMMSSVMNKLFERENVSNTNISSIAKERDDVIEPVKDLLSDDDDDDIIINVVSNAKNLTARTREPEKISTEKTRFVENKILKDGVIPNPGKLQKNNILHPERKRKPLPNKDNKHEIVSVLPLVGSNPLFDESETGFEENETDEDDLVINVASTGKKGTGLSGSMKRAKVSSKQFKSSEARTSEDRSAEDDHKEEKDHLLHKKKMKLISSQERNGNEVVSTVPAEKGPFVAQSSTSLWSQKSSWKALVGDKSDSAFSLSNILQNVDTIDEAQHISDGPKVDNSLDSKIEKLSASENLEGTSNKTEIANVVAEAQPNQPSTGSNNAGRGSSWLHKSSWIQLVSNRSNSFSIAEILPGTTALQQVAKPAGEDVLQSAAGNHSNIKQQYTASGVGKERDSIESILKSNHQTIDADKDASVPAVENLSNSEPDKGFGVDTSTGETCSFMRSSASLKEWAKTKASLKGSRKKKK
ncbi:uncharacterized protein LOC120142431 isoform X1 [Hibiscus syriacus]|uniref:uncharacterized protein LOC120142431 isoform X1 n=1 Tax=Hibiscus syriacus TaxID=106335 RepID=UPI001923079B|nr:uncharacterized protein LOC120142431 isoform X1 [Hibiscus syriacus]